MIKKPDTVPLQQSSLQWSHMRLVASQIVGYSTLYSTVYSGYQQRNHQISAQADCPPHNQGPSQYSRWVPIINLATVLFLQWGSCTGKDIWTWPSNTKRFPCYIFIMIKCTDILECHTFTLRANRVFVRTIQYITQSYFHWFQGLRDFIMGDPLPVGLFFNE